MLAVAAITGEQVQALIRQGLRDPKESGRQAALAGAGKGADRFRVLWLSREMGPVPMDEDPQ